MRRLLGILALFVLPLLAIAPAKAAMSVRIDIAAQRMHVTTSDGEVYNWVISSGRKGFRSPNGVFRPTRLEKNWYSRKYGGAMPYAVFFRGGYAIHGTNAVGALGRPASHGCIRLHTANARKFFALVKKHGHGGTRIALHGAAPDGLSQFAKASGPARVKHAAARPAIPAVAAPLSIQPKVAPVRGEATKVASSRVTTTKSAASRLASGKIAKTQADKAKLAKAAPAKTKAMAQTRKSTNWNAAREQILLRPSLPHSALGFQPYDLQRYRETGPRWPGP